MSEEPTSTESRVCVACDAPAVYHHQHAGVAFCEACGIYVAGQHHGKVTIARELLTGAVCELVASGLSHDHVMATVDGELEGVQRPTGPDIAYHENPRPWVGYLLDAIRENGEIDDGP